MRVCGQCGELNVPPGGDWPYWEAGMPICLSCVAANKQPKSLTEEAIRRIVREEITKMTGAC